MKDYLTSSNAGDSYTMHYRIVRSAKAIIVYLTLPGVKEVRVLTMTNTTYLNYYSGRGIAFVAPDGEITFSNYSYTEELGEDQNGYIVHEDGSIESTFGATIYVVDEDAGQYGTIEMDVTIANVSGGYYYNTTSKKWVASGIYHTIIFNTDATKDTKFTGQFNIKGYMLYEYQGSDGLGNYWLVSCYNAYNTHPTGSGGSGVLSYCYPSSYTDVFSGYKSYCVDNTTATSYTLHYRIVRTSTEITAYVTMPGQTEFKMFSCTNATYLNYYSGRGVAVAAWRGNVTYSNYKFTPLEG